MPGMLGIGPGRAVLHLLVAPLRGWLLWQRATLDPLWTSNPYVVQTHLGLGQQTRDASPRWGQFWSGKAVGLSGSQGYPSCGAM